MQKHGKLCRWNEERGFGFIKPNDGGSDIFVHISAFPKHAETPVIGDSLVYDISMLDGKPRAINIQTARISHSKSNRKHKDSRAIKSNSGIIIFTILFFVLGIIVYAKFYKNTQYADTEIEPAAHALTDQQSDAEIRQAIRDSLNQDSNSRPQKMDSISAPAKSSGFACDGRTYCSQMTSCAEATYFLQNCPGVKMDGGDGQGRPDGVPCEKQLCGD